MLSIVPPQIWPPDYTTPESEIVLPLHTPELQARLDAMYDAGRLPELIDPHAYLDSIAGEFPTPLRTPWPRPRLGTIYWPVVGLGRYAFGCFLLDEVTLAALRTAIQNKEDDNTFQWWPNRVGLRFRDSDDPTEVAREVSMRLIATRPLVRTTSDPLATEDDGAPVDAWVGIFVDNRWEAGQARVQYSGIDNPYEPPLATGGGYSWSDLLNWPFDVSVETTPAEYLDPNEVRWTAERMRGRHFFWLLDIAAGLTGSRFVTFPEDFPQSALPDYEVQRPTTTHRDELTAAHAAAVADGRLLAGGPIEFDDIYFSLPGAVQCVFGDPSEKTPNLIWVFPGTAPGYPDERDAGYSEEGYQALTTWMDGAASLSSVDRSAMALQWQEDWEAWQFGQYDTLYSGFVAAPRSAYLWAVEWSHSATSMTTRFMRAPLGYGVMLAPRLGSNPVEAASNNALTGNNTFGGTSLFTAPATFQTTLSSGVVPFTAKGDSNAPGGALIGQFLDSDGALVLGIGIGSTAFTTSKGAYTFDAPISATNFDTDVTLAADSDTRIATQHATKTYVDAAVAGLGTGTVTSVGLTAPSGFTVTNSPITTSGDIDLAITGEITLNALAKIGGSDGTGNGVLKLWDDVASVYRSLIALNGGLYSSANFFVQNNLSVNGGSVVVDDTVNGGRLRLFNVFGVSAFMDLETDANGLFTTVAITANDFIGDGSALTDLNASELTSGTVADARLSTMLQGFGALTDPAANTLLGWDDTDNLPKWFILGTGLSYNHATHTLTATTTPAANSITDAMLRQSAGLSVVGRSVNTTGDVADITSSADGQVFRRSGTGIGWGAIDLTTDIAVSGILLPKHGGTNNAFTAFTGPTVSTKTFTLPDASATILTTSAVVTVAQGGTGRNTGTTAYGVVAVGTTATGVQQTISPGTANQVLTSNGAAALGTFQDLPTSISGTTVLSTAFAVATANGTWTNVLDGATPLSVTLPAAGTYRIEYICRVATVCTAGTNGIVVLRLFNNTDSAVVTNSELNGVLNNTGARIDATATGEAIVTVTASKVIYLQAMRDLGTWTLSSIASDANGRTKLNYVKLSN